MRSEKGRLAQLSTHSREGLLVVTSWSFPFWPSEKVPGLEQESGAPSKSRRWDPMSARAIQLPRMRLNCGHVAWCPQPVY